MADSRISKIAASPMADSTESKGGNNTFRDGILGHLSGSFSTEAHNRSIKNPNICLVEDKGRGCGIIMGSTNNITPKYKNLRMHSYIIFSSNHP